MAINAHTFVEVIVLNESSIAVVRLCKESTVATPVSFESKIVAGFFGELLASFLRLNKPLWKLPQDSGCQTCSARRQRLGGP